MHNHHQIDKLGAFMKYTVLIADDEPDIIDMLSLYMDKNSFTILEADNGRSALEILREKNVDIALIDIIMPEMNGYDFVRNARKTHNIPIIMLSAKNEDTDKVMGLNIGADAYITKPFNPFEVVAYIKAMLRRYYELGSGEKISEEPSVLENGELSLNLQSFTFSKNGCILPLTSTEIKIMLKFMNSPGRVFTKAQLYEYISKDFYENDESTVMVHISNIRAKIEDNPSNPKYIKTIRGLGYKLEKE